MGNGITSAKEKEFQREKIATLKTIIDKYSMLQRRRVLIVGGACSGKTQLFRSLSGHAFQDEYDPSETAKFAFRVISTIKSEYANLPPLSFHFCCAPSSLL